LWPKRQRENEPPINTDELDELCVSFVRFVVKIFISRVCRAEKSHRKNAKALRRGNFQMGSIAIFHRVSIALARASAGD
jgi:hypothetical protein